VSSLDGSIDALIETIIGYRATNLFYAHMQMQFVGCLIDQYAEDCESVREHVKLLSYLMEQYLGSTVPRWQMPSLERTDRERVERVSAPAAYVPNTDNGNFLNAAILEALPDRVAVLTKDYRYLYANAASSAHVGKKPMEMIGRHIVEFVGEKRFRECIKGLLDSCFAGQACEYVYDRKDEVHVTPTKYRMSPLRDSSGDVIGALILAEDVGSSAATLAA
jgi:PAS domain S-box-containing protein